MKHITGKHIAIALATFAVTSIGLLWSWNALAELTGGPAAGFKHVLAALFILTAVRALMTPRRHQQRHRH